MGIWTDLAQWVGPTPNRSGTIVRHMYVVEHIADGTFAGTIAWQKNPDANVSSHFIVAKDGRCAQMVDTTQQAWTQVLGNPYSISVEFEGYSGQTLTAAQIEVAAKLFERAHREHGIPLQITSVVGTPGLAHHSMGYESGVNWGHQFCPGNPIKAQKPAVLMGAQQINQGGSMADSTLMINMATRVSQWQHGAEETEAVPGNDLNGEASWLVDTLKKINTNSLAAATRDIPVAIDPATLEAAVVAALQDATVLAALKPTITAAMEEVLGRTGLKVDTA